MRYVQALCVAALMVIPAATRAADGPQTDTSAFDYADAASFYAFDGCGDALAGRIYRRALAAKLAECPFTPDARAHFAARARAQQAKSNDMLRRLITEHGGLPMRLDGMTRTCREQQDSPEYSALRTTLERYAAGEVPVDAVVSAPCDAARVGP